MAGSSDLPKWQVYVLRCADGSLYTGIARDVERRLNEHEHTARGAKYLRGRGPLTLAFSCTTGNRGHASRAEHRIKQLSKSRKEALLNAPLKLQRLVQDS